MKKIAILFPGNLRTISLGGIDRYVKSVIFNAKNCEITVYGICEEGEYDIGRKYEREYRNVKYFFIPICTNRKRPLSLFYTLNERKWISELLEQYDSVFLQRIEFALPFAFKRNEKVSQIIHGSAKYYDYSYGKLRYIIYSLLEHISVIVTSKTFVIMNNEKYGVPYYKNKYKKYADRFIFATNPVSFDVFVKMEKKKIREELGYKDSDRIVLYVGRVIDNPKRVLLIPEICKELNKLKEQAIFLVIGNGPDEQKLQEEIKASNLESQIRCLGYVDDNELIAKYVNIANATINMSMYEGTCTSNVESVACGTPVVSTDVGEIRELIHENYNGVIVPDTERDTIATNMALGLSRVFDGLIKMDDSYSMYESDSAVKKLIDIL